MATYWENSCSFGLRYVSWYECLIVSLVFSHLGFWSGSLFLVAPFPDLCLLVPSVVVLFVLCFGVDFLCRLNLMYVFLVLVKFGLLFGTYWEIAAHSA